ncbi:MAG: tetratricopeptide repeat protein [Gammaproteobacteria bacterium]|nr:tetratricopeptide repeat protein [Gammaproteobacteria bacterium]
MNNLGAALEQQGRLDEARYYYDAALRSDPDLYKVRNNLKRVGG